MLFKSRIFKTSVFALLAALFSSCNLTEPEEFYSPTAGFLRVIIRSDNSDTNINILGVDYNITEQDSLDLLVFQGKAFNADSNYAILYHNIKSWRQDEFVYNILDWSSENGFTEFKIFESYVPPGVYDMITLGLIASVIEIGPYHIPISLPPDTEGVLELPTSFTIDERNVTQITLSLKPFQSMSRYRDDYVFDRQIEIESIEYLGQDEYEKVITDSDSLDV